jgi:hypothetical protein
MVFSPQLSACGPQTYVAEDEVYPEDVLAQYNATRDYVPEDLVRPRPRPRPPFRAKRLRSPRPTSADDSLARAAAVPRQPFEPHRKSGPVAGIPSGGPAGHLFFSSD